MEMVKYPAAPQSDAIDELAGVRFADPYRWLEKENDQVGAWQHAQSELAAKHVRSWPHFEALKDWVTYFSVERPLLPRHAGGLWFGVQMREGATQAQAVVSKTPRGAGRVLFDPASENPGSPSFLSWISPSPDGRILALGICSDGSENNMIRLIDVATGQAMPGAPGQVLMDAWLSGAQWLADSSGFYYTALTGSAHDFQQAVYFHRLGDPPPIEPAEVPTPSNSRDYRVVMVSRCGRWAVAIHHIQTPTPVALLKLDGPKGDWRPFVTQVTGNLAGHILGDRYIAVTTVNAPRGRVVAIPLDSATPNDPASWEEIIPQSNAVIRGLTPIGDFLYVRELVDTHARVRIFNSDGSPHGEVPLPGKGAIAEMTFPLMDLMANRPADAFVFGFSSLTESQGVYLHRPDEEHLETLAEPAARIENAVIEEHWAASADGTRVPYHSVRLESLDPDQPHPALIYAYGGGGVPFVPQFPGAMAAFVAAGGIFVHGHLRGGGEFGVEWWRGGRQKNKQNCYYDLFGIAEDIIARGVTKSRLLGVTGASNGGLMVGVALTQRPELWGAAIPRVPPLDMIGGCREPYLRFVIKLEHADIDDPEDVRRLASVSPYHLVKDGTAYPAVYIDSGDTDPRCPPWHARKFAARLQAAQAGENPILLKVWENVGHGGATAKDLQIGESTEWLAFAMQQLGLVPPDRITRPNRS